MILLTISIILIILGFIFFFLEIESDEAEVFGPVAIACFVSGVIFWFTSAGVETEFATSPGFIIITIILTVVCAIFVVIASIVFKKLVGLSKQPLANEDLLEKTGMTMARIKRGAEGYIKINGELWKARAEIDVDGNTKVKVVGKDELTLIIKPVTMVNCSNCGAELPSLGKFCPKCGRPA